MLFRSADKRIEIAEHLRYLPMGWFNKSSLGEISSVTTNTLENMSNIATRVVMVTTRGFLTAGIIAVMMLLYDWRMGIAMLIVVPIGCLCFLFMFRGYEDNFKRTVKSTKALNDTAVEYINGIEVIKAFGQSGTSYDKFVKVLSGYLVLQSVRFLLQKYSLHLQL